MTTTMIGRETTIPLTNEPPTGDPDFNTSTVPALGNWVISTEDREFQERLILARNVFVPLFVAIGLVGNTLSLLVFTRGRFKQLSSSKYPAALAVTDNVFLCTMLFNWLHDFYPLLTSSEACKILIFVSYTTSYLSVCFVVCFTLERYVAICHPLHARYIFAKVPAKAVVAVLMASAVGIYSCSLWTTKVKQYQQGAVCQTDLNYLYTMRVLTWTDTVITMIVPFFVIVIMNSFIAVSVCRFYSRRNHSLLPLLDTELNTSVHLTAGQSFRYSTNSHHLHSSSNNNNNDSPFWAPILASHRPRNGRGRGLRESRVRIVSRRSQARHESRSPAFFSPFQLRTTRTLLLVSVTFLVLNLPSHVLRLRQLLSVSKGGRPTLQEILVQEVALLAYYSTFALNFFLYTMFGRHFQQGLRELAGAVRCRCRCRRQCNRSSSFQHDTALTREQALSCRLTHISTAATTTTTTTATITAKSSSVSSPPPLSPPCLPLANSGTCLTQL